MNWYIAKIVFNIAINPVNNTKQLDEQLRLVAAKTLQEAYFKASLLGQNEEVEFVNKNNHTVNWKFIDVAEVILLTDLKDGMKIYSTTVETDESKNYIEQTKLKAAHIQNNQPNFAATVN